MIARTPLNLLIPSLDFSPRIPLFRPFYRNPLCFSSFFSVSNTTCSLILGGVFHSSLIHCPPTVHPSLSLLSGGCLLFSAIVVLVSPEEAESPLSFPSIHSTPPLLLRLPDSLEQPLPLRCPLSSLGGPSKERSLLVFPPSRESLQFSMERLAPTLQPSRRSVPLTTVISFSFST